MVLYQVGHMMGYVFDGNAPWINILTCLIVVMTGFAAFEFDVAIGSIKYIFTL